jgi:hypothetical protein
LQYRAAELEVSAVTPQTLLDLPEHSRVELAVVRTPREPLKPVESAVPVT